MFTLIQPQDFAENPHLLHSAHRLRKKVFFDRLGWQVPVAGDQEIDAYDTDKAQYLVWCSPNRETLYGLIRLLPTSEPTLLHDVFGATHGHDRGLIGADIFEGTRMCVDDDLIARDFPTLAPGAGFNLLFLALCEAGLALGVWRLVSNFEPAMGRLYQRAGLDCVMHGKAGGYGKRPVCCASFEVSLPVLAQMRRTIGVDLPVLTLGSRFRSLPTRVPFEPVHLSLSA
jgi:acyl homoserine lactone synthase